MRIKLDFETRWKPPLSGPNGHGAAACLQCPEAGINAIAWSLDNGLVLHLPYMPKTWYADEVDSNTLIELESYLMRDDVTIVAHNAEFERLVLKYLLHIDIPETKFSCTMARAAYYGYPLGLDDVAKALGCSQLKDLAGKKAMTKLVDPKWTPENAPDDFEKLYQYCVQDVHVLNEVDKLLPELPPEVQSHWELNCRINFRGVPVDEKAIDNALALKDVISEEYDRQIQQWTNGAVTTVGQVAKIQAWVAEQGLAMPDMVADTVDKMLSKDLPPHVRAVLQIRQEAGLSSIAKYKKLKNYCVGGKLFGMHFFYGTHTGRPTGTGPQALNFPRDEHSPFWAEVLHHDPELLTRLSKPAEKLKSALRGIISV